MVIATAVLAIAITIRKEERKDGLL